MEQRDKGENWENMDYKSTGGNGTSGIIFWRWRKKSVWNTASFNYQYQSKPKSFFFFLNEKGVLWAQRAFGEESMVQPSGLGQRKEMELPPSLGLRTIYIAPLRGRTNLTTRVWVRSLGHGWKDVKHPTPPDPWVGFHLLCLTS